MSPSFGAVGRWPHRTERAAAYLESLGLTVKLMAHADRDDGWASAPAAERAADLHTAFEDDDVAVVLCGIGGNHSNQLLPHLDYDSIRAHPKIFQGYSDITVLHWALAKHAGTSTFYGPALITQLAEFPRVFRFTDQSLRAAWFGDRPMEFEPAPEWTEEELDWDVKADLERRRKMEPGHGWVTIRAGAAEGPLAGGCLETICWHLKGSTEWLDLSGAIFFFETSEEAPSPAHVDAYLTDLEHLGLFESIAGLFVGRPRGYSVDDTQALWEVVAVRTESGGIPVLGNVDCGHTDPLVTLPLGARARLDATAQSLATLEPPTSPR